jgi:hypothetical protein
LKRLLSVLLIIAVLLSLTVPAFATGDPNIDTGGGGLGNGSEGNIWYGDSGVRVTIVDAESRSPVSQSIDLIKPPVYAIAWNTNNIVHFGKVSKLEYNAGASLSPTFGSYLYYLPTQELPKIIATNSGTGSISAIRSYFCDEQVLRGICGYIGFDYDELTSGDYKLIIEPLAAFLYSGAAFVMTATEAALYDQQVNGGLNAWMGKLTHKNLPLALFLETSDLGYPAWSGSTSQKASNADILSSLGIGIVRFTDEIDPYVPSEFDYEYRVDTDVITSVDVGGGQSDPDNPVSVKFTIEGTTYTVSEVYYPEGDSQLAWVKWHTPDEPCVITVGVRTIGGGWAQSSVVCNIIDLDGNDPPNPIATDRNDAYRASSVPRNAEVTSANWGIWSPRWHEFWEWVPDWEQCWHSSWVDTSYTDADGNKVSDGYWDDWFHWVDNGWWEDHGWWEFDYNSYSASLTATMDIVPDDKAPTATGSTTKSGYGIQQSVTARVRTDQAAATTAAQNAVTYFPEFGYATYWRLLDRTITGRSSDFEFKENRYSTFNRRTHFTPIWFPDGAYTPYTWLLDCWTPAGMLSMNLTDSVAIRGNLWEEWHIAPANP